MFPPSVFTFLPHPLHPFLRQVEQTDLTSRLHISNLTTQDCGSYSCVVLALRRHSASNVLDADSHSCSNAGTGELRTYFRLHVAEHLSDEDSDPSTALSTRIQRLYRRRGSSPGSSSTLVARVGRNLSPARGAVPSAVAKDNESIDSASTADDAFRFWSPALKRRRAPPPIGPVSHVLG